MELRELVKSKIFTYVLLTLAGLVILTVIFCAGVFTGVEKARFSYSWGENYYRNFAPPEHLPGPIFLDKGYMNPRGSSGQISKITGSILDIKSPDGLEKNVLIDSKTLIKKDQLDVKTTDLKIGDKIITFGVPDGEGKLIAKLIRVLDDNQ